MSLLLIGTSLAALTAGTYWHYCFRRLAPHWTTKDLRPMPGISEQIDKTNQKKGANLSLHLESTLTEEERNLIKQAFINTAIEMRWITVGGNTPETSLKRIEADATTRQQYEDVTAYMMECMLCFAESYGHILVCRDATSQAFLGAACLIPPYPSPSRIWMHFMRTVIPMGKPVPTTLPDKPDAAARFDEFGVQTKQVHHDVMGDTPHWYVCNLAVSNAAQGKGVGRLLMEATQLLAGDKAVYLECHDNNVPFYKKVGFAFVQKCTMKPKVPEGFDDSPFAYNIMLHKPSSSS